MLDAIYYPHTAIRDENFLKHALLYWDKIEYISPWENFNALPRYSNDTTKILAQFLKPHVPSSQEKHRAHQEIMKLIEDDLPPWLRVDRKSEADEHETYSMFRDKLLPETWEKLQERGVVQFRKHGDLYDYASHTYLGLTLMAILARSCAGTLKHTITDQTDAYGTFLKQLELLSGSPDGQSGPLDSKSTKTFRKWLDLLGVRRPQTEDVERQQLIAITLDVIDAQSLSVDTLVQLRTDKTALASELRKNYAEAIEDYVCKLSEPTLLETDALTLRDDFQRKMTRDMQKLHEELAPVARKTLLSKEVAVAVAAPLAGAAILTSTGIGAPLGGIIAAAALLRLRTEYRSARDTVFTKQHPMAFLYTAKKFRVY
jgi:hypothetical protein